MGLNILLFDWQQWGLWNNMFFLIKLACIRLFLIYLIDITIHCTLLIWPNIPLIPPETNCLISRGYFTRFNWVKKHQVSTRKTWEVLMHNNKKTSTTSKLLVWETDSTLVLQLHWSIHTKLHFHLQHWRETKDCRGFRQSFKGKATSDTGK